MLARAAALVRDHPLLTPLLIVYAAINVLAGIFVYTRIRRSPVSA